MFATKSGNNKILAKTVTPCAKRKLATNKNTNAVPMAWSKECNLALREVNKYLSLGPENLPCSAKSQTKCFTINKNKIVTSINVCYDRYRILSSPDSTVLESGAEELSE